MASTKGDPQAPRHCAGEGGIGYGYFEDMAPEALKVHTDRINASEGMQAPQQACLQDRRPPRLKKIPALLSKGGDLLY